MTDHRFDDGPFLTLAAFAKRIEGESPINNLWTTWPDFDEEEEEDNGHTIIGLNGGDTPVFVTCADISRQWAEAFCEALNRQQFTITLATTKE